MGYHVEIAGRPVTLRYTVNSLCAAEDRAGGALDGLLDRQFTATRLLLWCGMLDRQPVSLDETGALIGAHIAAGGTLDEIVEWCAEGLRRAGFLPDRDGAEGQAR